MGQKVNPIGFRLGHNKTWKSKWFNHKNYQEWLLQDLKIRKFISKEYKDASISSVEIERAGNTDIVQVVLNTARPGLIIGKGGVGIETLKKSLRKIAKSEVRVNIKEVRKPDLDAKLIAETVAQQLEKRVSFRRAMKKSIMHAMKSGAVGIKIQCAGRLAGADMARTEWYREGRVPLHTLDADIDYSRAEGMTTFGIIGVQVWLCKPSRGNKLIG